MKRSFALVFAITAVLASCAPSIDPKYMSKSVAELIADTKNEDGLVRSQAALTLGQKKSKEAVPDLIKLLGDKQKHVRYRAMVALRMIGSNAVPSLIIATSDSNRNVRFFSGQALKGIPSKEAQDGYKAYMDKEGNKILKVAT